MPHKCIKYPAHDLYSHLIPTTLGWRSGFSFGSVNKYAQQGASKNICHEIQTASFIQRAYSLINTDQKMSCTELIFPLLINPACDWGEQ